MVFLSDLGEMAPNGSELSRARAKPTALR